MKGPVPLAAILVAITLGAATLRLASLGNRPMHCDEAVHADKFGRLLESDDYVYDPREYHGPSLNFLTLPIARLSATDRLTGVSEAQLRWLPAAFGIILVGLVWFVRDELGPLAVLSAAVLTAVSPAMVFYSRYYIQEMLLVCFSFAAMVALWRYAREVAPAAAEAGRAEGAGDPLPQEPQTCSAESTPRTFSARQVVWLVLLGLSAGMMHATKETCVIPLFAMVLAAVLTQSHWRRIGMERIMLAGAVVVPSAAVISALFFSSFLDNPRGVIDSLTTYFYYLGRASGEGTAGRHVYPWHYYLEVLFWWSRGGVVRTEAAIAALALLGLVAGATGKGLRPSHLPAARFLGVYTGVMILIYSAMPYKTPWCALGFLHGMILLAGIGTAVLIRLAPECLHIWQLRGRAGASNRSCRCAGSWASGSLRAAAVALVAAAVAHLGWQACWASFRAYDDPNNPYVYAHTLRDVPRLAQRVEQIAAAHPLRRAMHIQVICPDHDYWPLPWYLRGFTRVGWLGSVPGCSSSEDDTSAAVAAAAPLIITQPEMEPALLGWLFETPPPGQRRLYVPFLQEPGGKDWMFRPHVPLRVYVRLDLWEAYTADRAGQISTEKE